MATIGWRFGLRATTATFGAFRQSTQVKEDPIYPTAESGSLSFDIGRDVCKTLGSVTLIPDEAAKVTNPADQELALYMSIDGVEYPMGIYSFTEETVQKEVALDEDGVTADIHIVSLGDRLARLIRNDGRPEYLNPGFDPSQEMVRLLNDTGLPNSISGSANTSLSPITWDGSTVVLSKIKELADLAGHRPPWMDNDGVIRSVQALIVDSDVIPLMDLQPEAGSIAITSTYLAAPNRIIVSDNSFAEYQLVGQWDAPSIAPHSYANRNYYRTLVTQQQGLGSGAHAQTVARTLGERATARQLDAQIIPTNLLDGPSFISYDDSRWLVESWSVNLAPGSLMRISAVELLEGENSGSRQA